jgi:hypothetical protein
MRWIMRATLLACTAMSAAPGQARWTGKVDLTIGGPDETRDAYMLNTVWGLARDRTGRIIIAQPADNTVRVFSPEGKHLYSFGQQGKGPGDLDFPCCVTIDAAGRLWVRENNNRRHSIFAIEEKGARFITSYPVRGGSGPPDRINWDSRGAILYLTTESRGGPIRTVRFHADTTGKELSRDTLRDPPVDSATRVFVSRSVPGGRATYSSVVPHSPQFMRAEGPGGQLAEANAARYEVDWLDGNMKLLRTLKAPADPPALSAREKAAARETLAEFAKRMQADIDLDAVRYPATKPVLDGLGFDLDGRLWVGRSVADGRPREADVYDPRGRLIARATWPADVAVRFSTVAGMTGLGIRSDPDTEIPAVVRVVFSR